MDINKCVPQRKGTYSTFRSAEKGCEHIGNNANHQLIRQFKVDGGVFPQNSPEEKCDYLLLNDTSSKAYYIELKGSDVEKAISQIENSIRLLHEEIRDYTILPRIVYHSRTHDIQGNTVMRWKAKYSGRAIIRSRRIEENIS